jgi:hypothetical protein
MAATRGIRRVPRPECIGDPRFPQTTYGPVCLYWYRLLADPWGADLCRHESCDEILRGCTDISKDYLYFTATNQVEPL